MPRAVDPWLHRICIRNHGPNDPWMRLILFTLNSTMDGDTGESFHGLESLAKGAAMGVSTVRAKLIEASRQGWIARYERARTPQGWKSYLYRSCVPDWIDLSAITFTVNGTVRDGEYLVDCHEAKYGAVEGDAVTGTRYPQKGRKRQPPATGGTSTEQPPAGSGARTEAPPADDTKHRQSTEEAPPADTKKDRQPLRAKFSSEVLRLSYQGEGALARTVSYQSHNGKSEDGTIPGPQLCASRPELPSNANPRIGGAHKIAKLAAELPELTHAEMARITGEPIELVQQVRGALP